MIEKQKNFEEVIFNGEVKEILNKFRNTIQITVQTREDLNNFKKSKEKETKNKNIISFNGKKFDLSDYYQIVLNIAFSIAKKNGYNSNIKFIKKISLIENMGGVGNKSEIEASLKKFSEQNYKELINNKSNKGAHGIFQVMPKTQEEIEEKYQVLEMIEKEKNNLLKKGYSKIDFEILENTLYSMFYIIELQKNYKIKTEKDLAGAYNAGPIGYKKGKKTGKLPKETEKYLKKFQAISKIVK